MLKAGTLFSYLSHLAQSQQQVKYVNEALLFVVDIVHSQRRYDTRASLVGRRRPPP